jgi:hypothetical protein
MLRNVNRDEAISYNNVALPAGRLSDRLRTEQERYFDAESQNPTQPADSNTKRLREVADYPIESTPSRSDQSSVSIP